MRTHSLAQGTLPGLATKLLSIQINKSWEPHQPFKAQCGDQNAGNITLQYTCLFHPYFKIISYRIKNIQNTIPSGKPCFKCLHVATSVFIRWWDVKMLPWSWDIYGTALIESLAPLGRIFRQDVWSESAQKTQSQHYSLSLACWGWIQAPRIRQSFVSATPTAESAGLGHHAQPQFHLKADLRESIYSGREDFQRQGILAEVFFRLIAFSITSYRLGTGS